MCALVICALVIALVWPGQFAAAQPPRVGGPPSKLGAVRTSEAVLPVVQEIDELVQKAQVEMLTAPTKEAFIRRAAMYFVREYQLDFVLEYAWKSMPFSRQRTLLIDEPLALALFHLQAEVRRTVGPELHTRVPGLRTDAGCAGDLVARRLLARYGEAATQPTLVGGQDRGGIREALQRIAVQVACLSEAQLGRLEAGMDTAFRSVSGKMDAHGFKPLIPSFARLLAPVQILMLDARKYRGARSRSWRWFVAHKAEIQSNVARSGWASGSLYVWDRRSGRLDAFPPCIGGRRDARCVDLELFLSSVVNPRALGLGNCSLAAMVSQGPKQAGLAARGAAGGATQLYVCPTQPCIGEQPQPAGNRGAGPGQPVPRGSPAIGPATAAQLKGLWPDLTDRDLSGMGEPMQATRPVQPGAYRRA